MSNRQIVNEQDELIGHKLNADMYATDIYRVSALWLTNSKGEVLLAQRSTKERNEGGLWGPAMAGTVEEGETYESNAYKEAEEEIGLTGVAFTAGPKMRVGGARNYFCQWFRAVVDLAVVEFTLQPGEVDAVRWISEKELALDILANPQIYITGFEVPVGVFTEKSVA